MTHQQTNNNDNTTSWPMTTHQHSNHYEQVSHSLPTSHTTTDAVNDNNTQQQQQSLTPPPPSSLFYKQELRQTFHIIDAISASPPHAIEQHENDGTAQQATTITNENNTLKQRNNQYQDIVDNEKPNNGQPVQLTRVLSKWYKAKTNMK